MPQNNFIFHLLQYYLKSVWSNIINVNPLWVSSHKILEMVIARIEDQIVALDFLALDDKQNIGQGGIPQQSQQTRLNVLHLVRLIGALK